MSKKLVLTAVLGMLPCLFSWGCCHRGACSTCSNGSCSYPGGYAKSARPAEYGEEAEYASAEEGYAEEASPVRQASAAAHRHGSSCKDGSCPY